VEVNAPTSAASPVLGEVRVDDVAYRTLSVLSIVSLILGLAAPLCLIAPLLLAIPITGIAVALLAIRHISASDGALIGRRAAVIALALCVVSMCASLVRTTLTQQLFSHQARQVASEWFALLQAGDAEKAFAMTVTSKQPPPRHNPGEPEEPADAAPSPLEMFRQQPVAHFLLGQGENASVRFIQDLSYLSDAAGSAQFEQQYDVTLAEPTGGISTATVRVAMRRASTNGSWQWLVANSQSDDLPPSSP
jgi:hypothetical protein